MSEDIKFLVLDVGVSCFAVREVRPGMTDPKDWRQVATFGTMGPLGAGAEERAAAHAARLTAEHANGRKPQSFCGPIKERSPCDFERVNAPEMLTAAQRATLVMCPRHEGAFR